MPNPLPWTIEPDGPTFLIRDANGRIVAEVLRHDIAERIVLTMTASGPAPHPPPPPS